MTKMSTSQEWKQRIIKREKKLSKTKENTDMKRENIKKENDVKNDKNKKRREE